MVTLNSSSKNLQIPASWESLEAVLLIWPNQDNTLFSEDIEQAYEALIAVLIDYVDVILIAPIEQHSTIQDQLTAMKVPIEYVHLYDIPSGNINVCEYGPVFVREHSHYRVINDNKFIQELNQQVFSFSKEKISDVELSLSGLDSDGNGILLIDKSSFKQHNPDYMDEVLERKLDGVFAEHCQIWIDREAYGKIRLCPNNILLVGDEIKEIISDDLVSSNSSFISVRGPLLESTPKLVSIPSGAIICDENDIDIRMNYTQFLVVNELVLVPQYNVATDIDALEIVSDLFPGYDIVGFPSETLSLMRTGLVNIVQPIPEGVLG